MFRKEITYPLLMYSMNLGTRWEFILSKFTQKIFALCPVEISCSNLCLCLPHSFELHSARLHWFWFSFSLAAAILDSTVVEDGRAPVQHPRTVTATPIKHKLSITIYVTVNYTIKTLKMICEVSVITVCIKFNWFQTDRTSRNAFLPECWTFIFFSLAVYILILIKFIC